MDPNDSPRSLWSRIIEPRAEFDFIWPLALEECVERIRAYEREQKAKRSHWTALLGAPTAEVGASYHNPDLYDFWVTQSFRNHDGSYSVYITDGYLVRQSNHATHIWGYVDLPNVLFYIPLILLITVVGILIGRPEVAIVVDIVFLVGFFGWQWMEKQGRLSTISLILEGDETSQANSYHGSKS